MYRQNGQKGYLLHCQGSLLLSDTDPSALVENAIAHDLGCFTKTGEPNMGPNIETLQH